MLSKKLEKEINFWLLYKIMNDWSDVSDYINNNDSRVKYWKFDDEDRVTKIEENVLYKEYKKNNIRIRPYKDMEYNYITFSKEIINKSYEINELELELLMKLKNDWEIDMFKIGKSDIKMSKEIRKGLLIWLYCWSYFYNVKNWACFYEKEPLIILESILLNYVEDENETWKIIEIEETMEEWEKRNSELDIFSIWISLKWLEKWDDQFNLKRKIINMFKRINRKYKTNTNNLLIK